MAKTKAQIIAEAQVVKNATEVGENTATRVGGVLEDLADADSVVIIPVTGTESGGNITLSSDPFTQVQTAVNAGQHAIVRVSVGNDVVDFSMNTYSDSVSTYIGVSKFLQQEFQIACTASGTVVNAINTSNTFSTGESVPSIGIDATPTQGSDNLVKSGGVYENVTQLREITGAVIDYSFTDSPNLFNKNTATIGYATRKDKGSLIANSAWAASDYIDLSNIDDGTIIRTINSGAFSGVIGLAFYDANKVFTHGGDSYVGLAKQQGDVYYRASVRLSNLDTAMVVAGENPGQYYPYGKLVDAALMGDKLAPGSVTDDKLAPGAIPNAITGPEQNYISYNRMNPAELQVGYVNKNTGAFVSLSSGNYRATGFIPVATNGLYCYCRTSYGQVGDGAVYDAQKKYLRALTTGLYDYVDGDAFVRWTIITTYTYQFVLDGHPTISGPFNPEYDLQSIKPFSGQQTISKNNIPELLPALSLAGKNGTQITAIGLSDTLIDTSWPPYLKIYKNVAFNGKISQFNYVDVGFGNGENNGSFVRIDATNIQFYVWTGTPSTATPFSGPVAHGLSISGFLDVVFSVSPKKMETCIVTASGMFKETYPYSKLREQYGYPFVACGENTAFSDVSLRCTADRFRFPIWFIGDSYTSLYEQRWPFQLIDNDFTKFLLCGLAGGSSPTMYTQLQKLLTFGAPKFLVWCLGMNDEFWVWKDNIIKVEKLCRTYGIELILQTIPWPTNGTKALINDYVRNSGYRYIDVYKAVSSDDNGTWYDGMNDDGVHPTTLGAKAIAGRVLTDFPEILQ